MSRLSILIGTAILLLLTSQSSAGIIALDFRDPSPTGPDAGTAGETLETGASFTVDGLTITAVPSGTSLFRDGLLANADSFGVDSNNPHEDSGLPNDVANHIQFDLSEALSISFDQTVELLEIDLQGLTSSEVGRVSAGTFSIDLFTGVPNFNGRSDVFTPTTPILVPNGVPVVFDAVASGAAFGLQGLTVNVISPVDPISNVVPEPGSMAIWSLIGLCMAGLPSRRRVSRV